MLDAIFKQPLVAAGIGMVAFAAIALFYALRGLLTPKESALADRLERAATGTRDAEELARPQAIREERPSPFARVIGALSRLARPTESEELSRTRERLDHAGFRAAFAVEVFFGSKLALSLALAGTFLLALAFIDHAVPRATTYTVVLAAIGFYMPNVWLRGRVTKRHGAITRALPDVLDLLVTCVEAGLGLEAAIARVVDEIGVSAPELSDDLRQTTLEIRAGVPRSEAFRKLAQRTGVEDLRSITSAIIQAETFGTSVARALRIQSESMRIRRTHRAEEKAATVATKMLVPLILCILPSLFCVILGPAVVRIVHTLLPSLSGQ